MKSNKIFFGLREKIVIFSFLMLGFVNFGVSNVEATTAQCSSSGGSCVVSANGFCPSGQDSLNIFCDNASQICCAPSCSSAGGVCSTNVTSCPTGSTPISGYFCSGGEVCCTAPPSSCTHDPAIPDDPLTGCDIANTVPDPTGTDISDPINPASSAGCADGSICFTSPLAFTTVEGVLGSILSTLQGIIVLISIVFIVIGAVMYITSAGKDKQIEMAKNAITAAMIGLAIGIAAPSFLREIATILGWGDDKINNPEVSGALTLAQIATNLLNFLLALVGVLGIIMLVIGGTMYLSSAGDEKKIDTAKSITKWAIIGIAVALAALVIVRQIARFFV